MPRGTLCLKEYAEYLWVYAEESYLAREWGKVAFNPDAICYTSVSQGGKCDVFIDISSRTRRVFLGLTPQNDHLGRRNTEKTT